MTEKQIKLRIQEEYDKINGEQCQNDCQILYNLICMKVIFGLENYSRPLYIDVKYFIKNYIKAVDDLDYGYDEIRDEKMFVVCNGLDNNRKLSIYYYIRRICYKRGIEISGLNYRIAMLEYKTAWKNKKYSKSIRLFVSSNIWALLLAYVIYILIVFVCIHPAPFNWMRIYDIELKSFSDNETNNYFLNTLGLLTGESDLSPTIIPVGIVGMTFYCLGKLMFFVLVANFIMKKIEDYITLK